MTTHDKTFSEHFTDRLFSQIVSIVKTDLRKMKHTIHALDPPKEL